MGTEWGIRSPLHHSQKPTKTSVTPEGVMLIDEVELAWRFHQERNREAFFLRRRQLAKQLPRAATEARDGGTPVPKYWGPRLRMSF